jgi:hypothetical protein
MTTLLTYEQLAAELQKALERIVALEEHVERDREMRDLLFKEIAELRELQAHDDRDFKEAVGKLHDKEP